MRINAVEQAASAVRPWQRAQWRQVDRGGPRSVRRPPLLTASVRHLLRVNIVVLALGTSLGMAEAAEQRISIVVAEDAVRKHVYRDVPAMNPSTPFPLREITPREVWKSMRVQVFEVTGDVREGCTYIVRDSVVYDLAPCWGGVLTSLAVADLDYDLTSELYFTYEIGSGVSRTNVGAFLLNRGKWEVVSADSSIFLTGVILRTAGVDTVAVYLAFPQYQPGSSGLYSDTEWVHLRRVGQISLVTTVDRRILKVTIPGLHKWRGRY